METPTTPVSPIAIPTQEEIWLLVPKPGKYAEPVPKLPLGWKWGRPALHKRFGYPSGVSKTQMVDAFLAVLYVDGTMIMVRVKDLYIALMNEVKDYCNVYDLLPYVSSTKDISIRKKFEFCVRDLRELGYLTPKNPEHTIGFLKLPPYDIKWTVDK